MRAKARERARGRIAQLAAKVDAFVMFTLVHPTPSTLNAQP